MSQPIPFAGATIDRAGDRRGDAAWLEAARADPAARALLVGRGGVGEALVPLGDVEPIALLGRAGDGAPVFVAPAPEDAPLAELRGLAGTADAASVGLAAYATALSHFHRAHRFCGRCGAATVATQAGHARACDNGHTTFPRTDPVVIMLVVDDAGDRILLGRQPPWPPRRFSALAGFVEPGESLEAAVAREVAEEAGLVVDDVRYVASQPWPFPASLMLGFHAQYVAGEPSPQDAELEDVRWFGRDEVAAAAAHDVDFLQGDAPDGGDLILPPHIAIARHLINAWLA